MTCLEERARVLNDSQSLLKLHLGEPANLRSSIHADSFLGGPPLISIADVHSSVGDHETQLTVSPDFHAVASKHHTDASMKAATALSHQLIDQQWDTGFETSGIRPLKLQTPSTSLNDLQDLNFSLEQFLNDLE